MTKRELIKRLKIQVSTMKDDGLVDILSPLKE